MSVALQLEENEDYDSDSDKEQEYDFDMEDFLKKEFTPRSYQEELFEYARKKNSILVLGTGSGKTFISILLIKELADSIRGTLSDGAKRTVFVVNTVPLVYQQCLAIEQHTGFKVGHYEGSMGVDGWSDEKWHEELDNHEVLVMVAQIFCDLILHNRFPLSKVNLIIMDECHHATGHHPMREIMRRYAESKRHCEVPRILGLTACVIHKKCKETDDVENLMKNLETVMDSALVTSLDQECVKRFTTKPKEVIIKCNVTQESQSYKHIKEGLENIDHKMQVKICNTFSGHVKNKIQKLISKQIRGIHEISHDLGEYILPTAIKLQAHYLMEAEADNLAEQDILRELGTELDQFYTMCNIAHDDDPTQYLSGKVMRLLEILRQTSEGDKCTLVFVTRRNTAKLLCSLLHELKKFYLDLEYLLPESVVGGTFNMKQDLKVSQEEIRKQKETIDRFRKGACNLIVSTSVLEEGIDIRKCNVVIRFDEPPNYRSYIQSLGRARATPSYYLTLLYEKEEEEVTKAFSCYKKINYFLSKVCHDRELPTFEDIERNFKDDEKEPPFAPMGISGPQITFNSAIQIINRYCGTLPQDKFTNLCVSVIKRKVGKQVLVDLSLPMNAPYRLSATGKPMSNWDDAKKSAALQMCIQLYKLNLLDKNLLPKKQKGQEEELLQKYVKVSVEQVAKGKPQPGTRKRRQIYERKICRAFKMNHSDLHLYLIYFQHIRSTKKGLILDTDGTFTQLGLLAGKELNCCPFSLYSKKWGEVNIIVEPVKKIACSAEVMNDVQQFHNIVSQLFLKLNEEEMVFNPNKTKHSVFIVPLTKSKEIDVAQLHSMKNLVSVHSFGEFRKRRKIGSTFEFELQKYENCVVSPCYRNVELFYVDKILFDETPLSPFPDSKQEYSSMKDYVKKVYNADISNDNQPLLECKHFSNEFNYLEIRETVKTTTKVGENKPPKFIPELCLVLPIAASLWCQILCMASILHRINGLQLEQELYRSVGYLAEREEEEKFRYSCLNYSWLEEVVNEIAGSKGSNLAVKLMDKKRMSIHPGMILQALTPLNTKDNFNLERLEVLGDSYLKFSVGMYLFCKETVSHEGALSFQRSQIVSNKTLYLLAKERELVNLFQGVLLSSATAVPYGFEICEDVETMLIKEKVAPQEWASYSKNADSAHTREAFEQPYNPWTDQLVPDKCVADCVEALIGVYLLSGGEKAANHFMQWLGLTFITEVLPAPETAVVTELTSVSEGAEVVRSVPKVEVFQSLNTLYRSSCLDRLEEILQYRFKDKSFIIQAITHPSYISNKVTDCYQRLEFLGDAVLDYLITTYIFSTFNSYNPGQLTDLRSHYVKNETLAKIAVKFGLHRFLLHMAPKLSGVIEAFIRMMKDGEKEFNTEDDSMEAEDVEVPKVLGDIVESLIGAVYIDSGRSLDITWKVIELLLSEEFAATKTDTPIDSVRALYEKDPNVVIELFKPTENEPAKCIIKMKGYREMTGTGKNKRTAKQAAARLALLHLNSSRP